MSGGIYLALAGAKSQLEALDVVSNNVANASTVGYQAERVSFAEVLSKDGETGVAVERGARDLRPGAVSNTGRALDLALDGPGGLVLSGGGQPVRSVSLTVSAEGRLVDASGRALLAADGEPLTVPSGAREVSFSDDGDLVSDGSLIGRAQISGEAKIRSGVLEGSNVGIVQGMVELIHVSRSFEALTRMIEQYKSVDERTAREIGSPR